MVVVKTAYKYSAYHSKEQKETLNKQMFLSKEPYNMLPEESKTYYKETGKTLTEYRMNARITGMKRDRDMNAAQEISNRAALGHGSPEPPHTRGGGSQARRGAQGLPQGRQMPMKQELCMAFHDDHQKTPFEAHDVYG
ncbi:MAG: helix-turn-helix domain-containing protein [Candidatus Marsarchaeota archaeon]|nr:helix-turn-helix domain-containing protein [Candidatus Marsarchaeota archaeon]